MTPNRPVHALRNANVCCSRCGAHEEPHPDGTRSNLIRGDGPVICRDCVHMLVRLSGVGRKA